MGIFTKKNHGREYDYALIGKRQFFLASKGEQSSKPENVIAALNYAKHYYEDTIELESKLIAYLPQPDRDQYIMKQLKDLEKQIEEKLASLSDSAREQYKAAQDQTRLRQSQAIQQIRSTSIAMIGTGQLIGTAAQRKFPKIGSRSFHSPPIIQTGRSSDQRIQKECPICFHRWIPRSANPRKCPACRSRLR